METINIVDFARRGEMTDGRADGFAENRSAAIDRDGS